MRAKGLSKLCFVSELNSLILGLLADRKLPDSFFESDVLEMMLYDFTDDVLESIDQKIDYFLRRVKEFEVKDFE